MHVYIHILGRSITSYGLMIITGILLANLLAQLVTKRYGLDMNDFVILECYLFLGAFAGAKLLYLIIVFRYIDWTRLFEPSYFHALIEGGFVFYGGLAGGLLFVFLAGKIHRIAVEPYIRKTIFLIPFVHAFGRIGCFMAGCCYGIPYGGVGAVVFPEGSFAPAGIKLFPVQILESMILMMIAFILFMLQWHYNWYYTVETYFILYGMARFMIEFYRYDAIRGRVLGLSTSQWISLALVPAAIAMIVKTRRKERKIKGNNEI